MEFLSVKFKFFQHCIYFTKNRFISIKLCAYTQYTNTQINMFFLSFLNHQSERVDEFNVFKSPTFRTKLQKNSNKYISTIILQLRKLFKYSFYSSIMHVNFKTCYC